MEQPSEATGVYIATVPPMLKNLNRRGHNGRRYFRSFLTWTGSATETAYNTSSCGPKAPKDSSEVLDTARVDTEKGCHASERRRSRFALCT